MKNKLTEIEKEAIKNCSNVYLKVLYISDFLFNNNETKERYFRVLKESNKTSNINIKKFYLYLTCKFNLKKRLPLLENTISNTLLDDHEKEEIDTLGFIDMYKHDDKDEFNDTIKNKRTREIIKSIRRN